MASDDENEFEVVGNGNVWVMTGTEFVNLGLSIFFSEDRMDRAANTTNVERFHCFFGIKPSLAAQIFEDLQTTTDDDARIAVHKTVPRYFLMALHHLKCYPKEYEREGPWDRSSKTCREWIDYYIKKIRALKVNIITWPDNNFGPDLVWCITVDGTHCWIREPNHKDWSQDSRYYSHKYNKAGVNYELGISLLTGRLVWMNGPFPAGIPDVKIFRKCGLKQKLQSIGKKAIGDKGYNGHPNECSTFNTMDCRAIKKFKTRALHRHEYFNNMTKRFDCLTGPFHHGAEQFEDYFESICVICQYQLDYGHDSLYDVLIDDIMDIDD